jgi:hypothetical protein
MRGPPRHHQHYKNPRLFSTAGRTAGRKSGRACRRRDDYSKLVSEVELNIVIRAMDVMSF